MIHVEFIKQFRIQDNEDYFVYVGGEKLCRAVIYHGKVITIHCTHERIHIDILTEIINVIRDKFPAATSFKIEFGLEG